MSKRKVVLPTRFLPASLIIFCLFATAFAAASAERVLYSFKGGADGAYPDSPLIADAVGNLYGTTSEGGGGDCDDGCGTVFELVAPATRDGAWTKTIIYQFNGDDGAAPTGGLIFDQTGNLYGATVSGTTVHDGTVFELSPPNAPGAAWKLAVLYAFKDGDDGAYPLAGVTFDKNGNLYGTTLFGGSSAGGGTVFQLLAPQRGGSWTENVIHRFTFGDDGALPMSKVLVDSRGAVYGTADDVFFKLTPSARGGTTWTDTVLYKFDDLTDGSQPGTLIFDRTGHLYGTNNLGGPKNSGTVFQLTPPSRGNPWSATVLHTFTGGDDGNLPNRELAEDRLGNLYGTTSRGSNGSVDTAFRLTRPASGGEWTKTILHEFVKQGDGFDVEAGVVFGKFGALFGTTYSGGEFNFGTVYGVLP